MVLFSRFQYNEPDKITKPSNEYVWPFLKVKESELFKTQENVWKDFEVRESEIQSWKRIKPNKMHVK